MWVSPSTFRRGRIEHGLTLPEPYRVQDREAAVAGLAGMGTEPDMDLGCNTFHPRPSGLLRDRGHGLPEVDRQPGFVEETATQVTVIFEHALQIEGLLELLTDERLDWEVDDPRRRSCSPSATTGRR